MSLRVWLPLTGDLHNQGISDLKFSYSGSNISVDNNGKIGKCYYFNGSSSMDTTYSTAIGTNDFSISMWVKIPTIASGSYYAICTSKAVGAVSSGFGIYWNYSQKKFLWSTADGSNATEIWMANTVDTIVYDKWIHLVMIRNNSDSKKGYFYINNVRYELASVPAIRNITIDTKIRIGRCTDNNYPTKMYLNDFKIFNKALSPKEVEEIAKGLVLHYKLDQPNPNLISLSTYTQDPWLSAIQVQESYYGKFAYRLNNGILYTKSGNGANNIFPNITYKTNTQYTLSIDWRDDYRTDNKASSMYLRFIYTDGSTATQIISPSGNQAIWTHSKMTSIAGKTISKITTTYGNGGYLYIANLKLEEGTAETGYSLPIDDLNTSIVYDSSGYNNNGTITGNLTAITPSPRYNCAIQFPGNSLIESEPLPAETQTISAWIKWNSIPNASGQYSLALHDKNSGLAIGVYNGGSTLISYIGTGNGGTGSQISCSLTTNTWYHIVVIKTGSTTRDVYINGIKATASGSNYWGGDLNKFNIGCRHIGGVYSAYLNGQIVDVRIYATALTAAQVKELYNTSMSIDSSGNIHAREVSEL